MVDFLCAAEANQRANYRNRKWEATDWESLAGDLFSEFYGFQISPVFHILMDTMFATWE